MKILGIDFVFYNVTDMKRSVVFYRDVLCLKVLGEAGETWAEFDAGNMTLAIGMYNAPQDGGKDKNNVSVALAVEDVADAVVELKGKGVKISQDTFESAGCSMAIALDPDGNQIILHHRKDGTVG